jgi:protein involved in polysaccharide export with SLBB domain
LLVQVLPFDDRQEGNRERYDRYDRDDRRTTDANGRPLQNNGGSADVDAGAGMVAGGARNANGRALRDNGRTSDGIGYSAAPGVAASDPGDRNRTSRSPVDRASRNLASLFDELNWDYAVIERLDTQTLQTQLIPFNLGGAVIRHNAADDLALLPGDVVTVFSQRDIRVPVARQTRLVSLEGEVGAPGVYQVLPGETLKALIARAGGFTPQAYVFGLEFTREEARQRQRQNLSEAAGRLEALAATQAAREAANRREDTQSAAVSSAATQAQLARISRIQPNGRIALELTPGSNLLADLPDVSLEHADRVLVPSRPGFVTVAGAVANSNAFLWKNGRTVGDYIRMAGLDEAANASQIFVLRADGTVLSANDNRGFFGFGGIDGQPLQPGDAVFVPNQFDFETWGRALVRNLKDFGQIFYQFGLGAAAITTLRNN